MLASELFSGLELVLLDRDGVINEESDRFIRRPAEWLPVEGSIDAIVRIQAFASIAVCTNQSGIGRGLFTLETLVAIHRRMHGLIANAGGAAVDVYFCPHLPDAHCDCRKPSPGLLLDAMRAFDIAPVATAFVGDSRRDLEAAEAAGCRPVLVRTGNGARTIAEGAETRWVFESLAEFAEALANARPTH